MQQLEFDFGEEIETSKGQIICPICGKAFSPPKDHFYMNKCSRKCWLKCFYETWKGSKDWYLISSIWGVTMSELSDYGIGA